MATHFLSDGEFSIYTEAFLALDEAVAERILGYSCQDIADALDLGLDVDGAVALIETRQGRHRVVFEDDLEIAA